jgi:hypothetical protein
VGGVGVIILVGDFAWALEFDSESSSLYPLFAFALLTSFLLC